MEHVSLSLAGFPFVLKAGGGAPLLPLPAPYQLFVAAVSTGAPAAELVVGPAEAPLADAPGAAVVWSCETWRLRRRPDGSSLLDILTVPDGRWIMVASATSDFSRATLRPVAGRPGLPAPFALNYPSDQVLLTNRLLQLGAVVLHACGVVVDGRGYVFCGRSGIGKTTMARMWRARGAMLLNDDRIILRLVEGEVRLFSSPWHGEEREVKAANVPLAAIFHLSQAPDHALAPLTGALPGARLVATALAPFYAADGIARLLEQVDRMTAAVPSFDLAFAPQPSVIDLCLRRAGA